MDWKLVDSAFVEHIKFKIHKSSFFIVFYVLEEKKISFNCSVKQDIHNGDRVHLTFFASRYNKKKENVRQQE